MSQVNVVRRAVYREQIATLSVLDEIVELEITKEYLSKGSSSLFAFLTGKLRYSEGSAMRRIHAARLIGEYPGVREFLRRREVSLCTVSLIATEVFKCREKGSQLIESIRGKSKREVERIVISLRGGSTPPLKEQIRVISVPSTRAQAESVTAKKVESKSAQITTKSSPPPLSPKATPEPPHDELYRISFTATKEVYQIVEELQGGMSHKFEGKRASIAEIFEAGVRSLKGELNKKRASKRGGSTTATSLARAKVEIATKKNSRYIPAGVRRSVFERDNSECQYQYEDGTKCCSTWGLEIDHKDPFSLGGDSSPENLRVTCRNHNQHLAREAGLLF